jgi:hypothetical protein
LSDIVANRCDTWNKGEQFSVQKIMIVVTTWTFQMWDVDKRMVVCMVGGSISAVTLNCKTELGS